MTDLAKRLNISLSLPPHAHALGHEWALDAGREATITVAAAASAQDAAEIANRETSGLAASVVTADEDAANQFLDGYAGSGAFWNASPRLLDGFKLLAVPETGINIDVVPGPRGPVTFRDLHLTAVRRGAQGRASRRADAASRIGVSHLAGIRRVIPCAPRECS